MAIIEFIKEAGESLLNKRAGNVFRNVAAEQHEQQFMSHAMLQYIRLQDALDVPDDLVVAFDVDDGLVSLDGTPPDEETHELIVLLAGNVAGVEAVDDDMKTARPGAHSRLHVVKDGETAASIAREHYGDAKLGRRIMDANRPVLRSSRDLRPGLTVRLPELRNPATR
jgi:nucleoid-associated protein YgaU